MSKANILIVEDNEMNMDIASQLLEMDGFTVYQAFNYDAVLEIAGKEQLDLILMDMQMPVKDGFEITKLLKNNPKTADIKVLAFTAMVMDEDQKNAFACGCEGIITKPIEVASFAKMVTSYL